MFGPKALRRFVSQDSPDKMALGLRNNRSRSTSDILEQSSDQYKSSSARKDSSNRYRTYTFEDFNKSRKHLTEELLSDFKETKSSPVSRAQHFVKRLISSLEKKNEICKADDEFLTKYYRKTYRSDSTAVESSENDTTNENTDTSYSDASQLSVHSVKNTVDIKNTTPEALHESEVNANVTSHSKTLSSDETLPSRSFLHENTPMKRRDSFQKRFNNVNNQDKELNASPFDRKRSKNLESYIPKPLTEHDLEIQRALDALKLASLWNLKEASESRCDEMSLDSNEVGKNSLESVEDDRRCSSSFRSLKENYNKNSSGEMSQDAEGIARNSLKSVKDVRRFGSSFRILTENRSESSFNKMSPAGKKIQQNSPNLIKNDRWSSSSFRMLRGNRKASNVDKMSLDLTATGENLLNSTKNERRSSSSFRKLKNNSNEPNVNEMWPVSREIGGNPLKEIDYDQQGAFSSTEFKENNKNNSNETQIDFKESRGNSLKSFKHDRNYKPSLMNLQDNYSEISFSESPMKSRDYNESSPKSVNLDQSYKKKPTRKRSFKDIIGSIVKWKKSNGKEPSRRFVSCDDLAEDSTNFEVTDIGKLSRTASLQAVTFQTFKAGNLIQRTQPNAKNSIDVKRGTVNQPRIFTEESSSVILIANDSFPEQRSNESLVKPSAIKDIVKRYSQLPKESRSENNLHQQERRK